MDPTIRIIHDETGTELDLAAANDDLGAAGLQLLADLADRRADEVVLITKDQPIRVDLNPDVRVLLQIDGTRRVVAEVEGPYGTTAAMAEHLVVRAGLGEFDHEVALHHFPPPPPFRPTGC